MVDDIESFCTEYKVQSLCHLGHHTSQLTLQEVPREKKRAIPNKTYQKTSLLSK